MIKNNNYLRFLILWTACCSALLACDTASNTENPDLYYFVRYYGENGNQYGADMLAMNDGSFILLGTDAEDPFDTDVYLLRVDALGEVIWEIRHGGLGEIWTAKDVELAADGNLVVLSDYKRDVTSDVDIRLLKFSPEGTLIATGAYRTESTGNELSRTVTPLSDGGFIISGMTDSTSTIFLTGETDPDLGDAYDIRVDQNLVRFSRNAWDPYNGFGSNIDVAVKAFERPGDTFYVFGQSDSQLAGDLNMDERLGLLYFSRDSRYTVEKVWYPGNVVSANNTEINHVRELPSALGGGFLVVGTSQTNTGLSAIFMGRMRPTLTFKNPLQGEASFYNTISLGRNIRGAAGAPSVSGELGFLILGNEVRTTGFTNFWLSKVDQTGQPLWSTTFGSEDKDDRGAAVMELPDGKIVILATMGLADNQSKMAFVKVNRDGKLLK